MRVLKCHSNRPGHRYFDVQDEVKMAKPNIMFIILDATRADACSCYGNPFSTTPALDQLATEGTLFEQAISPAPWTLPALNMLLNSL